MGQVFSGILGANMDFSLYENHDLNWGDRESLLVQHPHVNVDYSHNFDFQEILEMDNLIFISCNSDDALRIAERRAEYIQTNMDNKEIFRLRLRYHRELYKHLIDKDKTFFEIDYCSLWSGTKFMSVVGKWCDNFKIRNNNFNIRDVHKKWIYANLIQEKMKGNKVQ